MQWPGFKHHGVWSPEVEYLANHRVDLDTALLLPLDSEEFWKLKPGMRDVFNSKPEANFEKRYHTYYANIVLDFDWR